MRKGGVKGDDDDLNDFKSQILRRTSAGGDRRGSGVVGGGVGGGGGFAALNRVSSKLSIIMNLQRKTSRASLLASREASVESSESGRR